MVTGLSGHNRGICRVGIKTTFQIKFTASKRHYFISACDLAHRRGESSEPTAEDVRNNLRRLFLIRGGGFLNESITWDCIECSDAAKRILNRVFPTETWAGIDRH